MTKVMGKGRREKKGFKGLAVSFIINLSVFILWTFMWGYFHDARLSGMLKNLLLDIIGAFAISFSFWASSYKGELSWWNEGHILRYSLVVAFCTGALYGMPYLPFLAAPAAAAAVVMTIFSGGFCALVSYLFMIMQYIFLSGLLSEQAMVLVFSGLLGIVLFKSLDREFRYVGLLFAYLVGDLVCCSIYYAAADLGTDLGDSLMYLGIRLFSETAAILILLKLTGKYCIYRDEDFYKQINNPEHKLLAQLKKNNKEVYMNAVHTAYLSEKISRKIKINTALAKAGGYYHKIGVLEGTDPIESTLKVGRDNKFPKPLMKLLEEYGDKKCGRLSKEAAVVQLSDSVVSYITHMFQEDNDAVPDYEKIIDTMIRKKMHRRDWRGCELTVDELCKIREGLVEVKLYYDFLR